MITGTTSEVVIGAHQDDALELLSKALGAYNQGSGRFNGADSWTEMLINYPRPLYQEAGATDVQKSKIVAIKHVMETLKNQSKPDQNILPYRTYIWEGGKYPPFQFTETGELVLGETGVPAVHPKAGEDWCFKYGEDEWFSRLKFDDVKKQSKEFSGGYPKPGSVDYREECS